ncbi:MAG: hypothetical protein ACLVEJ_15455 [Parabacteroides sp.]
MKKNLVIVSGVILSLLSGGITAQTLPDGYSKKLKGAKVSVVGDTLIASRPREDLNRKWCWNKNRDWKAISI